MHRDVEIIQKIHQESEDTQDCLTSEIVLKVNKTASVVF